MSDGLQLFIGEDGSQIFFDANTGKRYTLLENNYPAGNINYQFPTQNYDYRQDINTVPMQQMNQHRYSYSNPQTTHSTEARIHQQNYKPTTPKQNQTRTTQHTTTQQNMLLHNHPQYVYQQGNTSTPTRAEQDQESESDKGKRGEEQNTVPTTNKRALNDSDDFITVTSNKPKNKVQKKDKNQQNSSQQCENQQTTSSSIIINNANKYNVRIEHLQRAVVHNLPCFSINFLDTENLPSVVIVSEELYAHFDRQNVKLNYGFSVIRYFGNQLKVGVKNKSDYQTLCNLKAWPEELNSKQISVIIPKFVPEQFTLVVRYIPTELSIEQVEKEVKRSASTADNFRKIVYSYARKSNDYRFTVSDLREYKGLLHLGHIGIGNRMRIVTEYRPAHKITYCSKCWLLGHLRSQCHEHHQKCRVCLLEYNENHNSVCSKQPKCAQCSSDHSSLDPECQAIQQYRSNLNRAVKLAVKDGAIKLTPPENLHAMPIPPPKRDNISFPAMPSSSSNLNTNSPPVWNNIHRSATVQQTRDITNQELLEQLKKLMDEKTDQIDARVQQIEKEINANKKSISEVRSNLTNIAEITRRLMVEVIKPLIELTPKTKGKSTKTVENLLILLNNQCEALQKEENTANELQERSKESSNDQHQVQSLPNLTN